MCRAARNGTDAVASCTELTGYGGAGGDESQVNRTVERAGCCDGDRGNGLTGREPSSNQRKLPEDQVCELSAS